MKKSTKSLSLVLMGSLTVSLGGCGSDDPGEDFVAYRSVDECIKAETYSAQECRDMALAAVRQTPAFASKAECEKEFGEGGCANEATANVNGQGGGSSWMPLMAGYMVGRYMGGGGYMQGAQPLYAPKEQQRAGAGRATGGFDRSFRTRGGDVVQADAAGKVANPSPAVRQGVARTAKPYAARSGGVSRGGFFGGSGGS